MFLGRTKENGMLLGNRVYVYARASDVLYYFCKRAGLRGTFFTETYILVLCDGCMKSVDD